MAGEQSLKSLFASRNLAAEGDLAAAGGGGGCGLLLLLLLETCSDERGLGARGTCALGGGATMRRRWRKIFVGVLVFWGGNESRGTTTTITTATTSTTTNTTTATTTAATRGVVLNRYEVTNGNHGVIDHSWEGDARG